MTQQPIRRPAMYNPNPKGVDILSLMEQVEATFGQEVELTYQTVNQGNDTPEEQESGTVQGTFNGNSTNVGRVTRYEFEPTDGSNTLYIFADEVESIEPCAKRIRCDSCQALMINGVFCHETGCPNAKKRYEDGEWVLYRKCFECGYEVKSGAICDCQMHTEDELEEEENEDED